MPLAFIAKKDEDGDVAALWGEVWAEGCTSDAAALRLYITDIVPLITAGVFDLNCRDFIKKKLSCIWKLLFNPHIRTSHQRSGFNRPRLPTYTS